MRRIKNHGVALTLLNKREDRQFIASFSHKKNIEEATEGSRYGWNKIEDLSKQERIAIGVIAYYHRMQAKRARA